MRVARLGIALLAVFCSCLLVTAPVGAAPEKGQQKQKQKQAKPKPPQPETPAEKLGIEAKAWGVIDARSGELLLSQAASERLPIASTTKLMTAYVAMKEMPLDKIVRAAPYDAEYGESLLGLRTGQEISVRDLIYGLILRSGNDAAHTLAIAAAGTQKRFVAQMNRHAAALGLSNTHYANPIGLDDKRNYSSARDLLTLTQRLLAMPAFARISDTRSVVLRSVRPPRRINTINELLLMEPWVTGVKTGHTWGAGYVLVGSGRKKGIDLISVAIAAPTDETRYSDNLALLEYGFSQYQRREPVHRGEEMAEASIRYSGGELPLRAAKGLDVGLRKGQQLQVKVSAPGEVEGPIRRGAVLGKVSVYVDGMRAGAVPLKAARAVPEASAFDRVRDFVGNNPVPIAIALFVILMGGVALYRRLSR
ncbi:MAG TPA: D-alanyl-D-alanine carboxypeptidase family protein [Solirubrobacterales bacterium]|jgi:D-alanyl-D-alanine carboxypeptidase (penicillin-binding protein 5/6)|nr:D-alanyl-D-alanine carboxypeptidase family protein [Solirubrobacterales bacterium]